MNELMVETEGGQWFYFKTNEEKALPAFNKFCSAMVSAGINDDNIHYHKAVLRNKDMNDIDTLNIGGC